MIIFIKNKTLQSQYEGIYKLMAKIDFLDQIQLPNIQQCMYCNIFVQKISCCINVYVQCTS